MPGDDPVSIGQGLEATKIARMLSPALRKSLLALPRDGAMTVSEMTGATGSALTLLVHWGPRLVERQWVSWGADRVHGQLRGEGYEYRPTCIGLAVRAALLSQDQAG